MSEKVTSIIFLAIVALVLIGFVVSITILIVKRIGRGFAGKAAVAKYGWTYLGNSSQAIAAVERILAPTLYTIQTGKHALSAVITGKSAGTDFTLVRHHYTEQTMFQNTRRGGVYTLLIIPRGGGGPEFWFMHRLKGAIGAMAEKFSGGALTTPADPAWSWSLFSSLDAFTEMGFAGGAAHSLEDLTKPGDAIFVYADTIIYGVQGELKASLTKNIPDIITTLKGLLTQ